jgi:hypothetical protein
LGKKEQYIPMPKDVKMKLMQEVDDLMRPVI